MTLCEHFALTHDYLIRKDGKLAKRYVKSDEEPTGCVTAFCNYCKTYWDGDNTLDAEGGVWIKGDGNLWIKR